MGAGERISVESMTTGASPLTLNTRTTPLGTRQALNLQDVAVRLGVARVTAKRWWLQGRLVGRSVVRGSRRRVVVPIEVVDFYLVHLQLPTKRDLYVAGMLGREFLATLSGPDGGLDEARDVG